MRSILVNHLNMFIVACSCLWKPTHGSGRGHANDPRKRTFLRSALQALEASRPLADAPEGLSRPLFPKLARRGGPRPPQFPRIHLGEIQPAGTRDSVPLAVGRQASVLDRPAPLMSRGLSAAHRGRCAAYAMSVGRL